MPVASSSPPAESRSVLCARLGEHAPPPVPYEAKQGQQQNWSGGVGGTGQGRSVPARGWGGT